MKVTVCQINPSASELADFLSGLKEHLRENESGFLLLPEMGFADWLAADKTPDAARWDQAVAAHDHHISQLSTYGVGGVMGTRPAVNAAGSRRNQAYVWSRETDKATSFHEKYYLPDEPGYYEHTWYDRGEKRFDTARVLGMRWASKSAPKCGSLNGQGTMPRHA